MNTDPYVLQQLVNNHRRDLVEAAQQARLRSNVAVTRRPLRPRIAWREWRRHPAPVQPAAAH